MRSERTNNVSDAIVEPDAERSADNSACGNERHHDDIPSPIGQELPTTLIAEEPAQSLEHEKPSCVDRGNVPNDKTPLKSAVVEDYIDPPTLGANSKLSATPQSHQSERDELSDSRLKLHYDFTVGIIDKQYRSYVWNDGKVQALVTIDTALIAGLLLILQVFDTVNTLAFVLIGFSFIFLLTSFFVCLIHAVPRMHSGIGNQENLRTIIGIVNLKKEEYHAKIRQLDLAEIIKMNCWQIAGMSKNNMRSHKLIRFGAIQTIIGVLLFSTALPIIVVSDWNHRNTRSEKQLSVSQPLSEQVEEPNSTSTQPLSTKSQPSKQQSTAPSETAPNDPNGQRTPHAEPAPTN